MWILLKELLPQRRSDTNSTTIRVDDDQICIESAMPDRAISIRWCDIDEIETFKLDLLTSDEICLRLRVAEVWYEVSESDDGLITLAEAMQAKFPTICEDWYLEVMQPPFATNRQTLWKCR